ncbi:methyltransferase domain-containing protein [Cupriavidus taiwanensis]|uniref:class I SAM-dependent methyltransferase n=1 Tax=Cupriavidus taiwanensis TaxID=164546 RepID=UPI00157260FC|nr:class I SAM-dependent methyltransferase [Cupriavidus taiwanensis]NSX15367.1 methyltransferase domain-containing protein [Cupriavidus taiwanensis]
MSVDEARLNAFMEKFVGDIGAVMHAATVVVGDELGLYKALAEKPMTVAVLAAKTHTDERYLREWLSAQAASGYVDYDAGSAQFSLNEEQAYALAQEGSPAFIPGAFQIAVAQFRAIPKMIDIFRNGRGLGWHEHDPALFHGTERFFRPGYAAHLVSEWIPALDGMAARLTAGATVADVGCGHGASTIIMAQAFPASRFVGFDYHEPSVRHAAEAARRAGVAERVRFEVASAKDYGGRDYDLVAVFDCLHDMGDPVGAARHVRETLRADGAWMIVEPFANDALEQNLNPVGRVFYSASTFICTPASRSQEVGLCLGAQAGEARMHAVAEQAGFRSFRRAAQTPFNLVYEVRP